MKDATILKLSGIWAVVILLIVDALVWKVDHAVWGTGIAVISGLAGYQVGLMKAAQNSGKGEEGEGQD